MDRDFCYNLLLFYLSDAFIDGRTVVNDTRYKTKASLNHLAKCMKPSTLPQICLSFMKISFMLDHTNKPLLIFLSVGALLQVRHGYFVLCFHKGLRFFTIGIFEPGIRIGNLNVKANDNWMGLKWDADPVHVEIWSMCTKGLANGICRRFVSSSKQ